MVECMDVNKNDLHGNEYNINSILIKGNDDITLVINEEYEDYIDKDCLFIVSEQLDCCLRYKDKLKR